MRLHCVLALGLLAGMPAMASTVYPVQAGSSLQFQGTQQGEKFTGAIKQFDARINFDPGQLANSSFEVTMQLKSMDTRSTERDLAMQTSDWFDVSHYPIATFKTTSFRQTPQGVAADADLTIKGRSKHIIFPFVWQKTPAGATLDAKVPLDRLDFGLGAGEWSDESMVGHRVDVIVHLVLGPAVATPDPVAPKSNVHQTKPPSQKK